jgi:hypothetical protein
MPCGGAYPGLPVTSRERGHPCPERQAARWRAVGHDCYPRWPLATILRQMGLSASYGHSRLGGPSPELVAAAPQRTSLGGAIPVQPMNDVALTRQPLEPGMPFIPGGESLMGSEPQQHQEAQDYEQPQHFLYPPIIT